MKKSDLYGLGLVVTVLVALGLVVLFSAGEANAIRYHHGNAWYFVTRQAAYLVGGIAIACTVARIDYRVWRDHPWTTIAFAAAVFLALWVVFCFPAVKGSQRWISLGPIRVQPSEFAKLAVVFGVAVWMDRIGWRVDTLLRGAVVPAVFIGIVALPVLIEPDFGSVMVIGLVGLLVMFVAGTRFLYMVPFILCGMGVFAYKLVTNANRMRRLAGFFGDDLINWILSVTGASAASDASAQRAAYQARQALIAIKNGGIWGVGLRQSMQKHYYLPEAHTDFIFAIGAEELGLFFSLAVILLFALFLFFAVRIAINAEDRFGRYLVVGMAFIIFFQAMFNLGVVCEALPTKGMALPFFSYGGTNLLSAFFAVGTIFSVGLHAGRDEKRWRM